MANALAGVIERKTAEEELKIKATYDELTGLYNRAMFFEHLNKAISLANRSNDILSVLFLDLDKFKIVNDTMGHNIGDLLLKEVAKRIKSSVRNSDVVSRMGGDEFVILLPKVRDGKSTEIVANNIVKSLSAPFILEGNEIYIGVSIGISLFPTDGNNAKTLLKNSDSAMYNAKEAGRGIFKFFSRPE